MPIISQWKCINQDPISEKMLSKSYYYSWLDGPLFSDGRENTS